MQAEVLDDPSTSSTETHISASNAARTDEAAEVEAAAAEQRLAASIPDTSTNNSSSSGNSISGNSQQRQNAVEQLLAEQGPTEQALAQAHAIIMGIPNTPFPAQQAGSATDSDSVRDQEGGYTQGTAIESDLLREWYALQDMEHQEQQQLQQVKVHKRMEGEGGGGDGNGSKRSQPKQGAAKSALAAAAAAAAASAQRANLHGEASRQAADLGGQEPGVGAQPAQGRNQGTAQVPHSSSSSSSSSRLEDSDHGQESRNSGSGDTGAKQARQDGASSPTRGEAGKARQWGSWAPNKRIHRAGVSLLKGDKSSQPPANNEDRHSKLGSSNSKDGEMDPSSSQSSSSWVNGRSSSSSNSSSGGNSSSQRTEDGAVIVSQRSVHARPWKKTRAPTERQATVKVCHGWPCNSGSTSAHVHCVRA